MSTNESFFKTREQQLQETRQKIDKTKKEVGSGVPGRRDLRVNLDGVQADRRQKQIEATLESAKNRATTTATQLEPLVTALERAKQVLSKMAPEKSFDSAVGNYDRTATINRLKGRVGRGNQQLASRLEKVFSR